MNNNTHAQHMHKIRTIVGWTDYNDIHKPNNDKHDFVDNFNIILLALILDLKL